MSDPEFKIKNQICNFASVAAIIPHRCSRDSRSNMASNGTPSGEAKPYEWDDSVLLPPASLGRRGGNSEKWTTR